MGFTVDIYDGNVLIDSITTSLLPPAKYPFAVGDRLVSVDGVAVNDLLDAFAKYSRYGNDRSTRRLAAARIVTRPQQVMPPAVDLGDSAVVVIERASGAIETYTIPWTKTGVPLRQIDPVRTPLRAGRFRIESADDPGAVWRDLQVSVDPHDAAFLGYASLSPDFALPQGLVRRLGGAADYFLSGSYMAGGRRIGYIRISHLWPLGPDCRSGSVSTGDGVLSGQYGRPRRR